MGKRNYLVIRRSGDRVIENRGNRFHLLTIQAMPATSFYVQFPGKFRNGRLAAVALWRRKESAITVSSGRASRPSSEVVMKKLVLIM
ncbi:MAG: hypothetical protein ACXVZV_05285, partial [Terriglobales bacterium]